MENQSNINEIISLIKNNKKLEAKIACQKAMDNNPKSEIFLSLMGNILISEKKFEEAKSVFFKGLTINPKNSDFYISLGNIYVKLNQNNEAIKNFLNALKIKNDHFQVLNNLGFVYNKIKKFKLSIRYLKKSILIKDNYGAAHYNIGFAYFNINDYRNAKLHLEKSLKLKHPAKDINFYLGEIFRNNKNYLQALNYYKFSQHNKTQIRILEILAITNQKDEYIKFLEEIKNEDNCDRRIASITPHISQEYKIKNIYPFCPNPLDFVLQFNLIKEKKMNITFINNLIKEIKSQEFSWQIPLRTTVKGFTSKGNLSLMKLPHIEKLEKIFLECMNKYKKNFQNENYTFITSWPKKLKFHSWSNSLKKEGYNISHIHPSGWLSGVMYLMVPSYIEDDEAGIEFSLYGDDFIKNKNKTLKKILKPSIGSLIMFPSSLYHKTIPFKSDEERMCVAFDLMPA